MWIKICGMTSPEAVAAALEARTDAIGFVFAESPRRLTPQRAAQLARPARNRVRCVAVTRHPTQSAVDEILEVFAPDVLQTDLTDLERLTLPVELEPGIKSPLEIASFVRAARAASRAAAAAGSLDES